MPSLTQAGTPAPAYAQTVVPVAGGNCVIESATVGSNDVTEVTVSMPQGQQWSSTGIAAINSQISTYQTAAKIAAMKIGTPTDFPLPATARYIGPRGCTYTVLSADAAAQITAIAALAATAANIGLG